jgi:hypothetical protein
VTAPVDYGVNVIDALSAQVGRASNIRSGVA